MVSKATVFLIVGGLTGSGIFAHTRLTDEPQLAALPPPVAAPLGATTAPIDLSNEAFQRGHIQASIAAQRPFATFTRVVR